MNLKRLLILQLTNRPSIGILNDNNKRGITVIDTTKIRNNLGTRDSIGVKRDDILELIYVYEEMVKQYNLDKLEYESRGLDIKPWGWSNFQTKH